MRRILAVIGVAGALAAGQLALAGPAGAQVRCNDSFTDCRGGFGSGGGGAGEGAGAGGGGGGRSTSDSGTFFLSGGGGFGGGFTTGDPGGSGEGGHCAGTVLEFRCAGPAYD